MDKIQEKAIKAPPRVKISLMRNKANKSITPVKIEEEMNESMYKSKNTFNNTLARKSIESNEFKINGESHYLTTDNTKPRSITKMLNSRQLKQIFDSIQKNENISVRRNKKYKYNSTERERENSVETLKKSPIKRRVKRRNVKQIHTINETNEYIRK